MRRKRRGDDMSEGDEEMRGGDRGDEKARRDEKGMKRGEWR
jgi:hypothetical protein